MDDPKDMPFKATLDGIARPYLEELFELLVKEKVIYLTPDAQDIYSIHTEKNIRTNDLDVSPRKIMEQLRDLQAVSQVVHHNTEAEKTNLGSLLNYIDFFNERNVFNIPLGDSKLRALLGNLNNVNEEDIGKEWQDAFHNSKIDFRGAVLTLLEYFSRIKVGEVSEKYDFILDPQLREYPSTDFFITAKRDHSKIVIFDIKFRANIDDPKSLILRGIEKLNNYAANFSDASKYLVILVYTNQQDHTFNRLSTQFHKILIERNEELLNRVFFIPVSIYKTEDITQKLTECYNALQGIDITFDYKDSPLNHGWTGHEETLNKLFSIFRLVSDSTFGHALELNLPNSEGNYFIDYRLIANQKWKFKNVIFVMRPSDDCKIYVEVVVQGDSKRYWLEIVDGEKPPVENSNNGTEFKCFVPFKKQDYWYYATVDVISLFNKTFRKMGLTFQRIEGIRLRGKLTIAKIFFD